MIKKRFNIKESACTLTALPCANLAVAVRLYESTEVAAASTSTANWMSMMRELDSLPAMTYHMQQAAAAAPEDAPPTQTHSSAVPKFSGKQLNMYALCCSASNADECLAAAPGAVLSNRTATTATMIRPRRLFLPTCGGSQSQLRRYRRHRYVTCLFTTLAKEIKLAAKARSRPSKGVGVCRRACSWPRGRNNSAFVRHFLH